jgi:hypothetical protein
VTFLDVLYATPGEQLAYLERVLLHGYSTICIHPVMITPHVCLKIQLKPYLLDPSSLLASIVPP